MSVDTVVEVMEPGLATTIQDSGRLGYVHVGVGRAGWVCPRHARAVNRAVGNPDTAAVFETAGGLVLRVESPCTIAATGWLSPCSCRAGDIVTIRSRADGLWTYVAIAGGLSVEPVLGSASQDTLAGVAAMQVLAGTRFGIQNCRDHPVMDLVPADNTRIAAVDVHPGPQSNDFCEAYERLSSATMEVIASSRIGITMTGVDLGAVVMADMPSQPLVPGAIQVPPDGRPIVMGVDHPTTGGYPVIGVMAERDLEWVADLRPGSTWRAVRAPSG